MKRRKKISLPLWFLIEIHLVSEACRQLFSTLADKRKKHVGCTSVQSNTYDITPRQEAETPTLHRECLSCAVEVPSTREGGLLTDLIKNKLKVKSQTHK